MNKNIFDNIGYEGKVVVVTGAASGIGRTLSELLVTLGAKVYAVDIHNTDVKVKKTLLGDLSIKEVIDDIVLKCPKQIDAVFLCHGVGLLLDIRKILMVNFVGTKYINEMLLPQIVEGGTVTLVSSVAGYHWHEKAKENMEIIMAETFEKTNRLVEDRIEKIKNLHEAYDFSKELVSTYVKMKSLSPEYMMRNIRINAVAPYFIETPLMETFFSSEMNSKEKEDLCKSDFKGEKGRFGTVEEVAYPLAFIGSSVCSYMKGQIIYLDYGLTGEWDYQTALK